MTNLRSMNNNLSTFCFCFLMGRQQKEPIPLRSDESITASPRQTHWVTPDLQAGSELSRHKHRALAQLV